MGAIAGLKLATTKRFFGHAFKNRARERQADAGFTLYITQRITALIMAPLVIGHIAVMIYAVQGGLSAGEILGRTRGSLFWGIFYGGFVITVSIHAAIGLRTVLSEWAGLRGAGAERSVLGNSGCASGDGLGRFWL